MSAGPTGAGGAVERAPQNDVPRRKLFGTDGVIYNLTVEISNPTDTMRTVSVVLSPDAGWASPSVAPTVATSPKPSS